MHASSIYGHVLQCYGSLLMLGVIALILSPVNAKEPCDFFDTVNVTGDRRLTDGSYVHENVTIPAAQVAQYSYIYKYRGEKIEVEPHLRGCICHLKPCLNVCNGWGNMKLNRSESSLNITFLDGSTSLVDVAEQFVLQEQRICKEMYLLLPEDNFSWLLNEKAVLWEEVQNINRTKADFCVTQFEWPKASGQYSIQPAVCIETSEFVVKTQINGIVMWLSIPFMLLTIAVYLIIPELRKCNGKLLACWLSSLSIAYSIHPTLAFGIHTQYSIGCKLAGYSIYYFIMAAFLWHNAMSFDTWRTVRNITGLTIIHFVRSGASRLDRE
ncbi:probable G-protein coupled receptor Mth-like 10 [Scaptodrosophila lebanonensis]|uniref:Probable G-protein coupled receptor Mth-like 10 n=1 Tax=Drosophila lebanonensis TaxID=7225 RepID=A0A6J2TKV4_DROLE|nr:probable G-protein coupled receptor Mth-like 10 [Scaptodrosophila lebanonensis]